MNKPTLIAVDSLNVPIQLNSARRGMFGMGAQSQALPVHQQLQPLMDGDGNLQTPEAKEARATQERLQELQREQARDAQQNNQNAQQAGGQQQGNEQQNTGVEDINLGDAMPLQDLSAEQIENLTLHSVTYRTAAGETAEINVDAPFVTGENTAGLRSAGFRLQSEGHIEDLQVNLLDNNTVVGNTFDDQRNTIMTGQSRITGFTLRA